MLKDGFVAIHQAGAGVDKVYKKKGIGTVVTGTVLSGSVSEKM